MQNPLPSEQGSKSRQLDVDAKRPVERVVGRPRYYWRKCYGMPGGGAHWALCDDESDKRGLVTSVLTVLLADYDNQCDGTPVGESRILKRIAELLTEHGI